MFPGAIWQVLGRVYLIKPYGVNWVISSTSQVLELCVFLFANVLIAVTCLLWYFAKISDHRRAWRCSPPSVLMPTLAILLHPKIFYGLTNRVLAHRQAGDHTPTPRVGTGEAARLHDPRTRVAEPRGISGSRNRSCT